jgi:His/Glu/Gln/Arg/opine family amino acid ABC transporter permease subunit
MQLLIKSAPLMLKGTVMTLKIACASVLIGIVFGILFGIANCRKLRIPGFGQLLDFYVLVMRGTPIYVQILIAYFALPDLIGVNLSPFQAGVLALGMNSVAYVGEIVRAGINAIAPGQWHAAQVLGYAGWQTLWYVILPQMLRNVLPALTNELVVIIKETSLLATIGLVELTRVSRDIIARELDPMTIYLGAAAIYLAITTVVSVISKHIEKGLHYD